MSLTAPPPYSLSRKDAAAWLGIRESRLAEFVTRGPLSKLPQRTRGEFTRADLAVCRVALALQSALGEHSERVGPYMETLAPLIWEAVRMRQPKVIRARMTPDGVTLDIVLKIEADGSIVTAE